MQTKDLINGIFEAVSGILLSLNCYRLYKDKETKGVSLIPMFIFTLWGYWNLAYYPSLNQWLSFYGGILVVIFNTLWFLMIIYYKYYANKTPKSRSHS